MNTNSVKANCTNCLYVKYLHQDGIRLERCSIVRHFSEYPINPNAREMVENGSPSLCEHHQPAKILNIEIVYE